MVHILNWFINAVAVLLSQVIGLLPTTPLHVSPATISGIQAKFGIAAWFLPLTEIATVITALVAAILVWYGVRLVMRFFRAVGG